MSKYPMEQFGEYEYPPEISNIVEACEVGVVDFSNDEVSTLICEIDRLAKLAFPSQSE
jgi:hypothetical protein